MKKINLKPKKLILYSIASAVLLISLSFIQINQRGSENPNFSEEGNGISKKVKIEATNAGIAPETGNLPLYGNWKNFSEKDGLAGNKSYCVKIDNNRILVGTHEGLSVYEEGNWTTYTTEDGLAHNGVLAIDVSEQTGDVWLGTMGGLSRWSAGKFENFNQLNSGMPNDLIYGVVCDDHDVWVATGGGAGKYDTYTGQWEIFTEQNAPMHEPWTYGVSSGDGKIFIAAWGGGVVEYNNKTKQFRDYTDPDGNMEIDLFPDDGLVHDITTGTSWANGNLWVGTYFGLSRYDGVKWKGYFEHDSGLASNFINYIKAYGDVVFICTDKGLSVSDGENWGTYTKNSKDQNGKLVIERSGSVTEMELHPSFAHNYVLGVDVKDGVIWLATSDGVSRGEELNRKPEEMPSN